MALKSKNLLTLTAEANVQSSSKAAAAKAAAAPSVNEVRAGSVHHIQSVENENRQTRTVKAATGVIEDAKKIEDDKRAAAVMIGMEEEEKAEEEEEEEDRNKRSKLAAEREDGMSSKRVRLKDGGVGHNLGEQGCIEEFSSESEGTEKDCSVHSHDSGIILPIRPIPLVGRYISPVINPEELAFFPNNISSFRNADAAKHPSASENPQIKHAFSRKAISKRNDRNMQDRQHDAAACTRFHIK